MHEQNLSERPHVESGCIRPGNAPPIVYFCTPNNLIFPQNDADREARDGLYSEISATRLMVFGPSHVLAAAHHVIRASGAHMPFEECGSEPLSKKASKAVITAQRAYVDEVLSQLSVKEVAGRLRYFRGEEDISEIVEAELLEVPCKLSCMKANPAWSNGIRPHIQRMLQSEDVQSPVGFVDTDARRITDDEMTPVITIDGDCVSDGVTGANSFGTIFSHQRGKRADHVINGGRGIAREIMETTSHFSELRERRAELRSRVSNGEMRFLPQFDRKQWPCHPVMEHFKAAAMPIVDKVLSADGARCDRLDLLYQTLFRATTYPVAEIFVGGNELEARLQASGVYDQWGNIPQLDPSDMRFPLNAELVGSMAAEQLAVIKARMASTALPIDHFVGRHGIFGEEGWQLQKTSGGVVCVHNSNSPCNGTDSERKVRFAPVEPTLANEIHRVFHYIHTPRSKRAFGLYLDGDDFPFSVVGFDNIDRTYKQDMLLMSGYDPSQCLDLARLYSRPGTPFNTSSTIFSLAFDYFREQEPGIQAVLSSFMPTYAHGMSMISAGFNDGSLIKKGGHTFGKTSVEGREVWENVTKRRMVDVSETTQSVWPLLPVIELLAPIQESPRFTPFEEIKGKMVAVDC